MQNKKLPKEQAWRTNVEDTNDFQKAVLEGGYKNSAPVFGDEITFQTASPDNANKLPDAPPGMQWKTHRAASKKNKVFQLATKDPEPDEVLFVLPNQERHSGNMLARLENSMHSGKIDPRFTDSALPIGTTVIAQRDSDAITHPQDAGNITHNTGTNAIWVRVTPEKDKNSDALPGPRLDAYRLLYGFKDAIIQMTENDQSVMRHYKIDDWVYFHTIVIDQSGNVLQPGQQHGKDIKDVYSLTHIYNLTSKEDLFHQHPPQNALKSGSVIFPTQGATYGNHEGIDISNKRDVKGLPLVHGFKWVLVQENVTIPNNENGKEIKGSSFKLVAR